jgi:putative membrane protein
MTQSINQTDAAADPRVAFAAERTLLAWIRTGLALMGFGFVVARFGLFLREMAAAEHLAPHRGSGASLWVGTGLIVLGVLVNGLAAVQHVSMIRRLGRNEAWELKPSGLGLALTVLLVGIGIALTAYLTVATPAVQP